jgi:CHASE1-domain containing sensor protein
MSMTVTGASGPDNPEYPALAREAARGDAGTRPWRYAIIALTGLIGVVASIGMFIAISGWQAGVAELRFTNLARDHLQTINSGLKDATGLLWSIRGYFESLNHQPTRTEFQNFSRTLRERLAGLRDTGWAPRVTATGRDRFEREVRAGGFPDFQIVERNADGKMVRAKDRAEYFPILYSDPGELNRPIFGFDLGSETMRATVIARARYTDQPAATAPVKLVNIQRPNGGLLSFIPVNARS